MGYLRRKNKAAAWQALFLIAEGALPEHNVLTFEYMNCILGRILI
jgi:hypothetical protein